MDEGGRRSFDATDTWGPLEQEDGEANGVSMVLRPSFQSLQSNKTKNWVQPNLLIFFHPNKKGVGAISKTRDGPNPSHRVLQPNTR